MKLFIVNVTQWPFLPNDFEFWSAISEIFKVFLGAISHIPWQPFKFILAICVECLLVNIPAKLFSILSIGYRVVDVYKFIYKYISKGNQPSF